MKNFFSDKRVLVTGGAGAFGKNFLHYLQPFKPALVRVFSRDEMKHAELKRIAASEKWEGVEFRIGDVCHSFELAHSFIGIDIAIHAAAMKHLPECETNVGSSIAVNVLGTQNVIHSFLTSSANTLVFLSTDKAPYASSVYGAQKYLGERLITEGARLSPENKRAFSLRYSNIMDSTGAVFHMFSRLLREGKVVIVNGADTYRGFLTQREVLESLEATLRVARGGEIFMLVPKAINIAELARSMREIIGKGEVSVRDTLGAGWEKNTATLVMAEEIPLAKEFPENLDTKIVLLDTLGRHGELPRANSWGDGSFTLEHCSKLEGTALYEFLSGTMRSNRLL